MFNNTFVQQKSIGFNFYECIRLLVNNFWLRKYQIKQKKCLRKLVKFLETFLR